MTVFLYLFATCVLCVSIHCLAVKERPPWFNLSIAEWNEQYENGAWQYLNTEPLELTRSAAIGVYYTTYGNKGTILDVRSASGYVRESKLDSAVYHSINVQQIN